MSRLDALKKKAIQARPDSIPNHNRAVAAYFDMVSHIYNDDPAQPVPEIDSPDFWALFDQLDLDCSRDEMRAWIDYEPIEDHILPHLDDSVTEMDAYLAAKK